MHPVNEAVYICGGLLHILSILFDIIANFFLPCFLFYLLLLGNFLLFYPLGGKYPFGHLYLCRGHFGFLEFFPYILLLLFLYCCMCFFLLLPVHGKRRNLPVFQGDSSDVGALSNPLVEKFFIVLSLMGVGIASVKL